MQQQYFIDHFSKRENKNVTNFELDAFHFWLRKNHAPVYRRSFKTSLCNDAGEELPLLFTWQLEKASPWLPFRAPFHITFTRGREAMLTTDLHGNCAADFLKGRLHFSSFLTLHSPWEFYLEKVLERSQIVPGSDAFVPVLDWSGHGQTAGQYCRLGPNTLDSVNISAYPTHCCTLGLCLPFPMFPLHQSSNPSSCLTHWGKKNPTKKIWCK